MFIRRYRPAYTRWRDTHVVDRDERGREQKKRKGPSARTPELGSTTQQTGWSFAGVLDAVSKRKRRGSGRRNFGLKDGGHCWAGNGGKETGAGNGGKETEGRKRGKETEEGNGGRNRRKETGELGNRELLSLSLSPSLCYSARVMCF